RADAIDRVADAAAAVLRGAALRAHRRCDPENRDQQAAEVPVPRRRRYVGYVGPRVCWNRAETRAVVLGAGQATARPASETFVASFARNAARSSGVYLLFTVCGNACAARGARSNQIASVPPSVGRVAASHSAVSAPWAESRSTVRNRRRKFGIAVFTPSVSAQPGCMT